MVGTVGLQKKRFYNTIVLYCGNVSGIKDTFIHNVHCFILKSGLYGDLPPASHETFAIGGTLLDGHPLSSPELGPRKSFINPILQKGLVNPATSTATNSLALNC